LPLVFRQRLPSISNPATTAAFARCGSVQMSPGAAAAAPAAASERDPTFDCGAGLVVAGVVAGGVVLPTSVGGVGAALFGAGVVETVVAGALVLGTVVVGALVVGEDVLSVAADATLVVGDVVPVAVGAPGVADAVGDPGLAGVANELGGARASNDPKTAKVAHTADIVRRRGHRPVSRR
jgi:hypothetical protein